MIKKQDTRNKQIKRYKFKIQKVLNLKFLILNLFVSCILFLVSFASASAATEFISIIDPDNGTDGTVTDYTSLSAWEAAVQSDLATSTTKVFSYSSASSTIPDGALVTGQISGATASSTHMTASTTSSQILLTNISGTFLNGEQVYVTSTGASSTYVMLSNAGDSAIAVAKCRSTGGSADTAAVTVNGWTASASNYIKIWTDPTDVYGRHDGTEDSAGYVLDINTNNMAIVPASYTIIDGLHIKGWPLDKSAIYYGNSSPSGIVIRNNLIHSKNTSGSPAGGGIHFSCWSGGGENYIYNNTVFDIEGTGIYLSSINVSSISAYNNTVYDCNIGISLGSEIKNLKNNISVGNIGDYSTSTTIIEGVASNNISSDSTATGTNITANVTLQQLDFINTNTGGVDLHIGINSIAKNAGTSTGLLDEIRYDIDGTARGATPDIGADEVPVDFTSIICENKSAGGNCNISDYSNLSTWEDKVEADLTASTTRVFGGSITGTLSENSTVNLCNGSTDTNIDGVVVATTSDQILIDGITGTSSPLITTSGYTWVDETCASPVNYWTVSGTGDALGASARAVGEIDGVWSVADADNVSINGWSTDSDNSIKIYTTDLARHQGKWDNTKYRNTGTLNASTLVLYEKYVWFDGLQIEVTANNSLVNPSGITFMELDEAGSSEIKVSNNIIHGDFSGTVTYSNGIRLIGADAIVTLRLWNNIIYGFNRDGDNTCGAIVGGNVGETMYVYNNTIYDSYIGISAGSGETIAINNLVASTTNPFYGTFAGGTMNNATDIADTPTGGTNTYQNQTFSFVSTVSGTEDLHLLESDTGAKNKGVDLSATSTLSFSTDIDGGPRNVDGLGWDIGADEVATKIYRSIGNISTAISNSATVSISGTTATFSAGQPDNVGVGDVIQFGGSGYYDVAFINGRTSSSTYSVQAWDGGVPTATTTATMNIFRAYREMDDWEDQVAGDVNSGIDSSVENKVLVGQDLVASNTIMMVACYYAATVDDAAVDINGWTTGEGNYIQVYTPYKLTEVGVSQRHSGVWDTGKYRLEITVNSSFQSPIYIQDDYAKIDGLQLKTTDSGGNTYSCGIQANNIASNNKLEISNNIIQSGQGGEYGIHGYDADLAFVAYNNIVYNFNVGLDGSEGTTYSVFYNNTVYNALDTGFYLDNTAIAINNIAINCANGFSYGSLSFHANCDYNISDLAGDAPGTHSLNSTTLADIKFYSTTAGSEDLRIQPGSIAQNVGTSTAAMINDQLPIYNEFSIDIQGHKRGTFDIGADEASEYFISRIRTAGNADSDYTTLSGWEAANQVDLTAWNTLVFSYSVASGTLADGVSVIGETSGATASSTHTTTASGTKQILLYNIDGDFESGERIYVVGSSLNVGNVMLSDIGSPAIAVAEGYNDWPATGLNDYVTIDGWTTGKTNYVKIYAPEGERHDGWAWTDTGKDTYSGFVLKIASSNKIIDILADYTFINGLILDGGAYSQAAINSVNTFTVSNSIILRTGFNGSITGSTLRHAIGLDALNKTAYVNNVLAYDNAGYGFYSYNGNAYINNFTAVNNHGSGLGVGANSSGKHCYNCLFSNNDNGDYYNNTAGSAFLYNTASDSDLADSYIGDHNYINQNFTFIDEANDDFRLSVNDTGAKSKGLDLSLTANASSTFTDDISGSPRNIDGLGWDIGASEATPDFVSRIRSADKSDSDYSKLSTWEAAIDSDLTTSTSMLFSVSDKGDYSTTTDDGAVVTFNGGATGTLMHINATDVAYITNINYTNGDISIGSTTVSGSGHSFYISNTGAQIGRAVAECYNDWATGLDDRTDLASWTADAEHYAKIYTPLSERHNGTPGSGFFVTSSGSYGTFRIFNTFNYAVIEGIEVRKNGGIPIENTNTGGYGTFFRDMLVYSTSGTGIYTLLNNSEITNSFIICGGTCTGSGINTGYGDNVKIRNVTITGFEYGLTLGSGATPLVQNTIAYNNTKNNFVYGAHHVNSSNNAANATTTIPGSNSYTNVKASDFVNAAGFDFHLSADSKLIGIGTSAPASDFTNDIDNESRGVGSSTLRSDLGKWDIGADQSPVDFYSKIRSSYATGDYNNLSTWEAAINSDLTASTSKVFTVTDLGTYATSTDDGLMLTFAGGGTGRLVHINKDYLLYATGTAGTIYAGTVTVSNGHTFVISDTGIQIGRAVAECYNDWPTGLVDYLEIGGWTTDTNHLIKIYTPISERHNGTVSTGFKIKNTAQYKYVISTISTTNKIIDGLIVEQAGLNSYSGIAAGKSSVNVISNNIILRTVGSAESAISTVNDTTYAEIYNNIIYGAWPYGIYVYRASIYNNTILSATSRGVYALFAHPLIVSNNIVLNSGTYDYSTGPVTASNNISSDTTAPGTNSITNATLAQIGFLNTTAGSEDFHISKDSIAVGAGTSSPSSIFTTDIDNENRFATTSFAGPGADDSYPSWDIGADQTATEFVSRIRTASNTDSDFTTLSGWEAAVQADLTATTTRVFYYYPESANGTIANGASVAVCGDANCATTIATASSSYRTATSSSHQILLTNIRDLSASESASFSGAKLYVQGGATTSNYVILASEGLSAIAVAEGYNDWASGLDTALSIEGWTTDKYNYLKIYAPISERHNGLALDSAGYFMGFSLKKNSSTILGSSFPRYTVIDGIIFSNTGTDYGQGIYALQSGLIIRNNLFYRNSGGTGIQSRTLYTYGGNQSDLSNFNKIYNNIIYSNSGASCDVGISGGSNIIYNNTVYGCEIGVDSTYYTNYVFNNLILNNSIVDYQGNFHSNSSNNISSDATAPGANSLRNITDYENLFVNYSSDDFRLMPESVAVDAGADISSIFTTDIIGTSRPTNLRWDIGAFEAPQILYRSVGNDTNNLIPAGTKVTVTATNTDNAVFDADLPANIGVGDILQIGTSTYQMLVIHGRTASSTYSVRTWNGAVPTASYATTSAPVAVYRAHRYLDDWEDQVAGDVNTSISSTIENQVLVGQDLVASNTAMFVSCYASTSPDNIRIEINGWETGTSTYIKVYTPVEASEVGVSQRHSGVWNDNAFVAYRDGIGTQGVVKVYESFVKFVGLQFDSNDRAIRVFSTSSGEIIVDKVITKNTSIIDLDATNIAKVIVKNSLCFNLCSASGDASNLDELQIYNSTFIKLNTDVANTTTGIRYALVKNVAALNYGGISSHSNFLDIHASSTNLICNDGGYSNHCDLYPNSIDTTQDLVTLFTNPENYDYSIRNMFSEMYDKGTTISIVTDDIAGTARPYDNFYDIGAFEFNGNKPKFRFKGGQLKMQGTIRFR